MKESERAFLDYHVHKLTNHSLTNGAVYGKDNDTNYKLVYNTNLLEQDQEYRTHFKNVIFSTLSLNRITPHVEAIATTIQEPKSTLVEVIAAQLNVPVIYVDSDNTYITKEGAINKNPEFEVDNLRNINGIKNNPELENTPLSAVFIDYQLSNNNTIYDAINTFRSKNGKISELIAFFDYNYLNTKKQFALNELALCQNQKIPAPCVTYHILNYDLIIDVALNSKILDEITADDLLIKRNNTDRVL